MLYCPLTWIRGSVRNSWVGWGSNTQRAHFYFVRKPDPREELTRTGHFVKFGQFLYVRKNTKNTATFLEKQMRFQRDQSVYLVRQPLIEHGNQGRMTQRKLFISKSKDLASTQLPKAEWENFDFCGGKDNMENENIIDKERDNSVKGEYDITNLTLMPQDESHEKGTPIQCQSTNNFIPNSIFPRLKHKSIHSGRSLGSNNPKLEKLSMTNESACSSTTVPIFASVSVPHSNIIKAPTVVCRETWCRMEEENKMNKDLGRRTSLKLYGSIEDSRETMFLNDSAVTNYSEDPRKLHTEKKGFNIGIFGVN
jgi:hypothetical protein